MLKAAVLPKETLFDDVQVAFVVEGNDDAVVSRVAQLVHGELKIGGIYRLELIKSVPAAASSSAAQ
eukprot:2808267-Amphidinium_carterae.1